VTSGESRYLQVAHQFGLELLAALDQACEATGTSYMLFYGTLLGAVREGGWIPWDDDVDVVMFRDDFDRFRQACRGWLPWDVQLSDVESNSYSVLPRLVHTRVERLSELGTWIAGDPAKRHLCLDIFVLDRAPRGGLRVGFWMTRVRVLERMVLARQVAVQDVRLRPGTARLRRWAQSLGVVASRAASAQKWRKLYGKELRRYASSRLASDEYRVLNSPFAVDRTVAYTREMFTPAVMKEFSTREVPVPRDSDAVLRLVYGSDYRVPPPEDARKPEHFGSGILVKWPDRSPELITPPHGESAG